MRAKGTMAYKMDLPPSVASFTIKFTSIQKYTYSIQKTHNSHNLHRMMAFSAFSLLVAAIAIVSLFDMANCVKKKEVEIEVKVAFTEIPADVPTVYVAICGQNKVPLGECTYGTVRKNKDGTGNGKELTFKPKISGTSMYIFWSKYKLHAHQDDLDAKTRWCTTKSVEKEMKPLTVSIDYEEGDKNPNIKKDRRGKYYYICD